VQLLFTDFGAGKISSYFLNKFSSFGLVHTIVKIGIWTFDWDDSELVEAKLLGAQDRQNELFALEIGTIQTYDFLYKKTS